MMRGGRFQVRVLKAAPNSFPKPSKRFILSVMGQAYIIECPKCQYRSQDIMMGVGFLFGSEASGLSNKEISYANYTLHVPTNPDFKSLNLSHSLIIVAHFIANIIKLKSSPFKKSKKVKPASKKDIQSMVLLCVRNLDQINFFKPKEKRPIMLENLRNIFYKMDLSDKETRILSSVFASLGKKR